MTVRKTGNSNKTKGEQEELQQDNQKDNQTSPKESQNCFTDLTDDAEMFRRAAATAGAHQAQNDARIFLANYVQAFEELTKKGRDTYWGKELNHERNNPIDVAHYIIGNEPKEWETGKLLATHSVASAHLLPGDF